MNEVFGESVTGIFTARDELALDMDRAILERKIGAFRDLRISDEEIIMRFGVRDNYMWKVGAERKKFAMVKDWKSHFDVIHFRPFDVRHIYYQNNVVWRPRREIMQHLQQPNLALVTSRQALNGFRHAFVADTMVDLNLTGSAGKYGSGHVFPLFLYPTAADKADLFSAKRTEREPNLSVDLVARLTNAHKRTPTPEQVLYYVYAVLYSPPIGRSMRSCCASIFRACPSPPMPRCSRRWRRWESGLSLYTC